MEHMDNPRSRVSLCLAGRTEERRRTESSRIDCACSDVVDSIGRESSESRRGESRGAESRASSGHGVVTMEKGGEEVCLKSVSRSAIVDGVREEGVGGGGDGVEELGRRGQCDGQSGSGARLLQAAAESGHVSAVGQWHDLRDGGGEGCACSESEKKQVDGESVVGEGRGRVGGGGESAGYAAYYELSGKGVRGEKGAGAGAPPRQYVGMVKGLLIAVIVFVAVQFALMKGSECLLSRANALGRRCHKPLPHYARQSVRSDERFAMVTCSDGAHTIPKRSFEGLAEMITPNKEKYVKQHGYDYIDASDILDRRRPPSWSKILAVQKYLRSYDWVFWTDADSVVTNPDVTLQEVIDSVLADSASQYYDDPALGPSPSTTPATVVANNSRSISSSSSSSAPTSPPFDNLPDFIVTEDHNGINAGMFFIRNSSWSLRFLDLWWSQIEFVRPFGRCKSGDNDALKYLIANMDDEERRRHVRIPEMQCAFNSNLWRPSVRGSKRLIMQTKAVWRGVFAKGDFMVHLAGLNNKKKYVTRVLKDLDHVGDVADGRSTWSGSTTLRTWRRKLGYCDRRGS